jgi:tetratricopeptide (TPR) repeat protein
MTEKASGGAERNVPSIGRKPTVSGVEKKPFPFALVVVALVVVVLGIAAFTVLRPSGLAVRIAELAPGGEPPETIEGLQKAIAAYEARVEETVKTAAQAGIYWKILAVRYMDRAMYGEALEALHRAVEYFPEDETLYYLTGLSASVMAKSALDFSAVGSTRERERLFALAESAHRRALALDPAYARALYALGVLLVFELDRSAEAIPFLERFLSLREKDVDGMFVLARAYYVEGRDEDAVTLYDRVLSVSKDPVKREEAEANKKTVLDGAYETR